MTSTGNHDAEVPEADEADRAWQDRPVDEDASEEQPASTVPPVGWEANEADLQEQLEAIAEDEDEEYPREVEEPE
jgi:hypothetical protein